MRKAGLLLAALLLASTSSLISSLAAPVNTPYLNYAPINNTTLKVSTPFYDLTYDARAGGITNITIKNDMGDEYKLLTNATTPLLLVAVNGHPATGGTIRTLAWSDDRALIAETLYKINNTTIKIIMKFYSWQPQIDVSVEAKPAPATLEVTLVGEERLAGMNTSIVYSFYKLNGSVNASIITGSGSRTIPSGEVPLALGILGLSKEQVTSGNETLNKTVLSFFVGSDIIDPAPSEISYYSRNLPGNITLHTLTLRYVNTSKVLIKLQATNYLPSLVADPPVALAMSAAIDITGEATTMASLNAYIDNLRSQINQSKKTIQNLTKKLIDLQKKLDNYKGCEDHYKQELKAWEYQYNRLKERLTNTGKIEIAVFIIGIVLGLIGGKYFFSG